jgi:hypothetical protein
MWPPHCRPTHGYPIPTAEVLAVAYQASLLQEETRPVLGHLVLALEQILTDLAHRSTRH